MNLPFEYMPISAVMKACGIGSKSCLYAKIKAGAFPEPDRLGSSSRWRSDRVAEWLQAQAVQADAEREQRKSAARAKAQKMVAGRRETPCG